MEKKLTREELAAILNSNKEKLADQKLRLIKSGGTEDQVRKLAAMEKARRESLITKHGDDLMQQNMGGRKTISGGTLVGELSQEGLPDMSKVVNLGKENMWRRVKDSFKGKKLGLGGLAAGGLGLAAAMAPKDSMASDMLGGADRAITEGDPMDFIMGGRPAGEGSDVVQEMKPAFPTYSSRDMVKDLGGNADINPKQAVDMTGEDQEEPSMNKSRFNDLRKRVK